MRQINDPKSRNLTVAIENDKMWQRGRQKNTQRRRERKLGWAQVTKGRRTAEGGGKKDNKN